MYLLELYYLISVILSSAYTDDNIVKQYWWWHPCFIPILQMTTRGQPFLHTGCVSLVSLHHTGLLLLSPRWSLWRFSSHWLAYGHLQCMWHSWQTTPMCTHHMMGCAIHVGCKSPTQKNEWNWCQKKSIRLYGMALWVPKSNFIRFSGSLTIREDLKKCWAGLLRLGCRFVLKKRSNIITHKSWSIQWFMQNAIIASKNALDLLIE